MKNSGAKRLITYLYCCIQSVLTMFSISLRMTKTDPNMSELWLIVCKIQGGPKVGIQYIVFKNNYCIPTFGPLCTRWAKSRYTVHSIFFLLWRCDPTRVMASWFLRFLDHTQRRTTVGSTPLDEWSARRRDLYLTTYNTHNRQTSMPPVGFEATISACERPQTYALDRAATGTGQYIAYII